MIQHTLKIDYFCSSRATLNLEGGTLVLEITRHLPTPEGSREYSRRFLADIQIEQMLEGGSNDSFAARHGSRWLRVIILPGLHECPVTHDRFYRAKLTCFPGICKSRSRPAWTSVCVELAARPNGHMPDLNEATVRKTILGGLESAKERGERWRVEHSRAKAVRQ